MFNKCAQLLYRHAEGFDPTSVFVALTLSPSQIVAIIVGTAWTGKQVVFGGELLVVGQQLTAVAQSQSYVRGQLPSLASQGPGYDRAIDIRRPPMPKTGRHLTVDLTADFGGYLFVCCKSYLNKEPCFWA